MQQERSDQAEHQCSGTSANHNKLSRPTRAACIQEEVPKDTVFGKLAEPGDQLNPPEKDLWEGEQFEVDLLALEQSSTVCMRSHLSSLCLHFVHLTHRQQGCKKLGGRVLFHT